MGRVSKFEEGLNAAQLSVVRHVDGPVLVLAGAGSGKTRTVTRRIACLIGAGHAKPEEILGVTFTNKAAGEMRERVSELIGAQAAKGVTLSTFHAFCLKVLREHCEALGLRKNFSVAGEADSRTIIRRALQDIEGVEARFDAGAFRGQISLLKGTPSQSVEELPAPVGDGPSAETAAKYRTWLPEVMERYESAMRAANAVDFDDLLGFTLRLWREHPAVLKAYQKRFRFVMVDEYQDTNAVQYALVRHLAAHGNLCVVGDDDQSIYAWRGADVRNILEFERHYPKAMVVTLDKNYRSTRAILDAANGVIGRNTSRREKALVSTGEEGRPLDWLVVGDEEHEAKLTLEWMERLRREERAEYGDFAVLYRSNQQSRAFEVAFRAAGVPYAVFGGQDLFERMEVRDVMAYLRYAANPWDEASFLRIVNVPRRGIGDKALQAVHDICRTHKVSFGKGMAEALRSGAISGRASEGMREFLGLMQDVRGRFRAREASLADLAKDLIARVGYRAELQRTSKSGEQALLRWQNVDAVFKALEQYENETREPSLTGFLDQSSLDADPERGKGSDERRDAVSLMTIHSAKGLEFPYVFIAGCEEGLLPHDRSIRDNAVDEERRLFYVAITRAQRHAVLTEAVVRTRHGRERTSVSSRFLSEIPAALIRKQPFVAREGMAIREEERAVKEKLQKARGKKRRSRAG